MVFFRNSPNTGKGTKEELFAICLNIQEIEIKLFF